MFIFDTFAAVFNFNAIMLLFVVVLANLENDTIEKAYKSDRCKQVLVFKPSLVGPVMRATSPWRVLASGYSLRQYQVDVFRSNHAFTGSSFYEAPHVDVIETNKTN